MNLHVVVGQLEFTPRVEGPDLILRLETNNRNLTSGKVFSTYHSMKVINGVRYFGEDFFAVGDMIGGYGTHMYVTREGQKEYSIIVVHPNSMFTFLVDSVSGRECFTQFEGLSRNNNA